MSSICVLLAPQHMVRARLHTGDTFQLRHTGHVSAVRGREVCQAALSCTAGKQQKKKKTIYNNNLFYNYSPICN